MTQEDIRPRTMRLPLADDDHETLQTALGKVPRQTKIHYDWDSKEGTEFLQYVDQVRRKHVPVPWIAHALGLSADALLNVLNRRSRNGSLWRD